MSNPILLFTSIVVILVLLYYYEIVAPVNREQKEIKPSLKFVWIDFIYVNINSCYTEYHCLQCKKLIQLFEIRFKKEIPAQLFYDCIENMYNRLDTKYKLFALDDERLSNLSADDALKIIME